jgi:hypothetical protein
LVLARPDWDSTKSAELRPLVTIISIDSHPQIHYLDFSKNNFGKKFFQRLATSERIKRNFASRFNMPSLKGLKRVF